MIRVLLADDHAVLRAGLRALLALQPDIEVIADVGDGDEAVRVAMHTLPDVAVLDLSMPGNARFAAVRQLTSLDPPTRVLVLTMHEDHGLLREALQAGAAGYVRKKAAEAELLVAIRAVAQGELFVDSAMTALMRDDAACRAQGSLPRDPAPGVLTTRETQVLGLLAQGYTHREIGEKLAVSVKTIETHKMHISEKLGLKTRAELMRYARVGGLLPLDP